MPGGLVAIKLFFFSIPMTLIITAYYGLIYDALVKVVFIYFMWNIVLVVGWRRGPSSTLKLITKPPPTVVRSPDLSQTLIFSSLHQVGY